VTLRIALDAMGGELGPEEMVTGAIQAVEESDLDVMLIGDENVLSRVLQASSSSVSRLHVVHASQTVSMDESPFEAIRKKKDSSIVKAFDYVKNGEADGVVSAGNSGATMASAIKSLGRLENISRPGIASIFPTLKKPLVMMDVGANVDCRPHFRTTCSRLRDRASGCSVLVKRAAREIFWSRTPMNFFGKVL
jgi:glycerol-3-phosphate acyltransferase PlsX